jgi:hypothetical protein
MLRLFRLPHPDGAALAPLAAMLLVLTLAGTPASLHAQGPGRIVGRILDAAQGTPIAGAQLEVVGTTVTGVSAVDGRYTLAPVPAGAAQVRVHMVGYQPKIIAGIVVPAGKAVAQDISLEHKVVQLEAVTVTSEAERGSVNRALDEQRNAVAMVNSVSAEQIAHSPDADAGQAVQRVSGVTLLDGKYVYVRGLGERYTTTSLNGARIPSPDPDRKVVPMDLFPSNLLEAVTTAKTFTPDQPGDFSGARVDIRTREFPLGRVITVSTSAGLNAAATGRTIVRAPTEGGEAFGFASSARSLPDPLAAAGDLSGVSTAQMNSLIGGLRNVWSAQHDRGTPNAGFGLSIGGEDPVFGQRIGYLGSFGYSFAQEVRREQTRSLAQVGSEPGTAVPYNTYNGESAQNSVLWGAMANLSTRVGTSTKLSFNNSYTRSADNEAAELLGSVEEFSQFNPIALTNLTFIQRSVRSNQLAGEHLLSARNTVEWSVTSAGVMNDVPDRSSVGYTARQEGTSDSLVPYQWTGAQRFAERAFSTTHETSWDVLGSARHLFGAATNPLSVKVGGAFRTVDRDVDTRAYDIVNAALSDEQRRAAPELIFTDANAEAGSFVLTADAALGRYVADEHVLAGFAQLEVPLGRHMQVVGGARLERWTLDLTGLRVDGTAFGILPANTDLLPSVALNVQLTADQNLRFSASQTLSRPQFRELAPTVYREGVGLLSTEGNPDLRRTLIQNLDLRWEWFPRGGEVVSATLFAKHFDDPIERVIVAEAGGLMRKPINADNARDYGLELELRKNLSALAAGLAPFSAFTNVTLVRSRVTPGTAGGVLTNAERPLLGQSGYVVNAGLGYARGDLSATVLYNVAGRRVQDVGTNTLPDAYEEARHLLDATLQFSLAGRTAVRLDGKNLFDTPYRVTQGAVLRERYKTGRVFGLGLSWKM